MKAFSLTFCCGKIEVGNCVSEKNLFEMAESTYLSELELPQKVNNFIKTFFYQLPPFLPDNVGKAIH